MQDNGMNKRASGERRIEVGQSNFFGQVEHAGALCTVQARAASSRAPSPACLLCFIVVWRYLLRAHGPDWMRCRGLHTDGVKSTVKHRAFMSTAHTLTTWFTNCVGCPPRSSACTLSRHTRPSLPPSQRQLPPKQKELARNRQALYSDRERRRREQQEEAETKDCTFCPNIAASRGWGAGAGAGAGAGPEGGGCDSDGAGGRRLPLHERLHKEAREREAARALAHHHLEKEALRECTFQVRVVIGGWGGRGGVVA